MSRERAESYLPVADSPSWNWTPGRQNRVQRSEQKREGKERHGRAPVMVTRARMREMHRLSNDVENKIYSYGQLRVKPPMSDMEETVPVFM